MARGMIIGLEIPSAPEYVAIVREAVESIAHRMQFDAIQIDDLKLAVGEACTNAVKYGCPKNGSCNVVIKCKILPDSLVVEIRNRVAEKISPHIPTLPDTSKEGGFGLYMIRKLMDEVDIKWGHKIATVRMLKKLR